MGIDARREGPAIPSGAQFGRFSGSGSLPEGAVVLTEAEIVATVRKQVYQWVPSSEMWGFRYAPGVLCGVAIISGSFFNGHLRSKFRLGTWGPILTFAPCAIIPAFTTFMVQEVFMTRKLVLREFDCLSCAQIRCAGLQVLTAFLQPLVLSLLTCSIAARNKYTINLPPINSMKILTTYSNMLKPLRGQIMGLFLLAVASGIFVVDQEVRCIDKIHKKLMHED